MVRSTTRTANARSIPRDFTARGVSDPFIGILVEPRVASPPAHPFTRSPHVAAYGVRCRSYFGPHPPRPCHGARGEPCRQRASAAAVRPELGVHHAGVSRVRDSGRLPGGKRALDGLIG